MTVKAEARKEFFERDLGQLEALRRRIIEEPKSDILITPRVERAEPNGLPKNGDRAGGASVREKIEDDR
jgi:hypothetical protein